MNLVRMGHYFTPSGGAETAPDSQLIHGGSCRLAIVAAHDGYGGAKENCVNLVVFSHSGDFLGSRQDIPVEPMPYFDEGDAHDSFHLSGECPWLR